MERTPAFLQTRQTLLGRLRNWEDQASWQEFFDLYWGLIYRTALRAGLSDAEAQDVVQETIVAVSQSLPKFKFDPQLGSFKGWLLRITSRRIADQYRLRLPQAPPRKARLTGADRTDAIERIPDAGGFDPSTHWEEEWENNLAQVARERVKRKVDAKQYQLFDLHVSQQWPVKRIVHTLKVSAGQVYLAKHRVGSLLRNELKALKAKHA